MNEIPLMFPIVFHTRKAPVWALFAYLHYLKILGRQAYGGVSAGVSDGGDVGSVSAVVSGGGAAVVDFGST